MIDNKKTVWEKITITEKPWQNTTKPVRHSKI